MTDRFDALAAEVEHRLAGTEAAMRGIMSLPSNRLRETAQHEACLVCDGTGGYDAPNDGNGCPACRGTGWSDVAARESAGISDE